MPVDEEYIDKLKKDLIEHSNESFKWTNVQNNNTDAKINIFNIDTYDELVTELQKLNIDSSELQYIKRRWFLQKISVVEEFLFTQCPNVKKNENKYDKKWDFKINNIEFDLKGTRVPLNDISIVEAINNPAELIKYYYRMQSKETRFGFQNRLFLVHYSELETGDCMKLRCKFDYLGTIIKEFCWQFSEANIFKFRKGDVFSEYINNSNEVALASVIMIIEDKEKRISRFFAVNKDSKVK